MNPKGSLLKDLTPDKSKTGKGGQAETKSSSRRLLQTWCLVVHGDQMTAAIPHRQWIEVRGIDALAFRIDTRYTRPIQAQQHRRTLRRCQLDDPRLGQGQHIVVV